MDTVTVYVSPQVSSTMTDALVALAPGRVIFNPGAENPNSKRPSPSTGSRPFTPAAWCCSPPASSDRRQGRRKTGWC